MTTNYSEFDNLVRSRDDRAVRIATVASLLEQHIGVSLKTPSIHAAHNSVQTMMVTANYLVAVEALREGIPWIYSNQKLRLPKSKVEPEGRNPDEPQEDTSDSLSGVTEFSTLPLGHESLSLNPYGGFGSPLRKFSDLVNHLTHTAFRNGETLPFPVAELDLITAELTQKNRDRHIGRQALRAVA
jgi:exoribonuclease R